MLTKTGFLRSIAIEIDVLKHLHGKIRPEHLDRPLGEGMRTTLELLRYLTYCGSLPARCCIERCWDRAAELVKSSGAAEMAAADFPAAMDRQRREIEALVAPIPEEDFEARGAPLPWGVECKLGEALVDTSLKFLAAYRMQLFLQLKSAGVRPLDTFNCWLGQDRPGPN